MMELRACQRILRAGFTNLQSPALPQRSYAAQCVGIEAQARADLARARAPVTEMNRHAIVGMSRDYPRRTLHATSLEIQIDHVGVNRAVFAARTADLVIEF